LPIYDSLDRVEHVLADPLVEGTNVELDDSLVRDHVLLGPRLERADRDDGGIRWPDLPRDDRLQAQDSGSGHHDGVNAGLRHRAVRATAEHPNLEAVAGGGDDA